MIQQISIQSKRKEKAFNEAFSTLDTLSFIPLDSIPPELSIHFSKWMITKRPFQKEIAGKKIWGISQRLFKEYKSHLETKGIDYRLKFKVCDCPD